mmetsp:Transcript_18178/g.51353  ORF Transcript_18178/g.51353 Transcript_18178/m.51353 type:complete len:209 (+) Transcript_18178:971-1597(+)
MMVQVRPGPTLPAARGTRSQRHASQWPPVTMRVVAAVKVLQLMRPHASQAAPACGVVRPRPRVAASRTSSTWRATRLAAAWLTAWNARTRAPRWRLQASSFASTSVTTRTSGATSTTPRPWWERPPPSSTMPSEGVGACLCTALPARAAVPRPSSRTSCSMVAPSPTAALAGAAVVPLLACLSLCSTPCSSCEHGANSPTRAQAFCAR